MNLKPIAAASAILFAFSMAPAVSASAAAESRLTTCNFPVVIGSASCSEPGFTFVCNSTICHVTFICAAAGVGVVACTSGNSDDFPARGTTTFYGPHVCDIFGVAINVIVQCTHTTFG
jgi:hypothetical protein